MSIKDPVHPGWVVKDCLEEHALSVTDAATVLDVTRPMLSRIINGRSAISPEMALRLSKAFGDTPEMWLQMQMNYDLAVARRNEHSIRVKRYEGRDPELLQPSLEIQYG